MFFYNSFCFTNTLVKNGKINEYKLTNVNSAITRRWQGAIRQVQLIYTSKGLYEKPNSVSKSLSPGVCLLNQTFVFVNQKWEMSSGYA